jgi:hypothetical protein
VLGAVGPLQLEVVKYRLQAVYDAAVRLEPGSGWSEALKPGPMKASTFDVSVSSTSMNVPPIPEMPVLFAVDVSVFEPTAVMLTEEAFTVEPLPTKALEPPPMLSVEERAENEAPPPLTSVTVGTVRCGVREPTTSVPLGTGTPPPELPAASWGSWSRSRWFPAL